MKGVLGLIFRVFGLLSVVFSQSLATHLRAGELTARKTGILSYEFSLVVYAELNSLIDNQTAIIDFGDNSSEEVPRYSVENIEIYGAKKNTYIVNHTFSAPGRYTVSYKEFNRNGSILNMSNSVNTPFYVECEILIDPGLAQNTTPIFQVLPLDKGNRNAIFTHSASAWDADGDSLVFKLTEPKQDTGVSVSNYRLPNDPIYNGRSVNGGSATFSIDPISGLLTWDTPGLPGLYNIAFIVEEWRNGIRLGYITRDMQIEVLNTTNQPPTLTIPNDTCIVAGSTLTGISRASDSNSTLLRFQSFGGIITSINNKAVVNPKDSIRNNPAEISLTWTPGCNEIRSQPYIVTYKVEDSPSTVDKLATIDAWQIQVHAPPVTNLVATPEIGGIKLSWDTYACPNASRIIINRTSCIGDTSSYSPCTKGSDTYLISDVIATLPIGATGYIDRGNTTKLARGAVYCYQAYVQYDNISGGVGVPSKTVCTSVSSNTPLWSGIRVLKSDSLAGSIEITWKVDSLFYDVDTTTLKLAIINFDEATRGWRTLQTLDLQSGTLTLVGLNTLQKRHTYSLLVIRSNGDLVYAGDTVSSAFLSGFVLNNGFGLQWSQNAPWNDVQLERIILRKTTTDSTFNPVATVVGVNQYIDRSINRSDNDALVFYKVLKKDSYTCDGNLGASPIPYHIVSVTQEIALTPADTNAPCSPQIQLLQPDCDQNQKEVRLIWNKSNALFCDTAVQRYIIYASYINGENLIEINNTPDTTFKLNSLPANLTCFQIKAESFKNILSPYSNRVCLLPCYYLEMPNVFTPNGDGYNDFFAPIPFPRQVEALSIQIFNRWGAKVYQHEGSLDFSWDGNQAPDGIYYYSLEAIVVGSNETVRKKGWIQLIR